MLRTLAIFIVAVSIGFAVTAKVQAAGDPAVCLKTCIEQYGSDKKQSCALQCGYGQGVGGGTGGGRDCGSEYKQCMQGCRSDNNCKNACRKARTTCY